MKTLSILSLMGLLSFSACSREAPNPAPPGGSLAAVEVRELFTQQRDIPRVLPGNVQPTAQATIAARIMGRVETAAFEIGDTVEAGQAVVRISAPETAARVAQAEAALAKITRDHQRESDLLEKNASTAETVRALADARRAAEAALAEARALMDEMEVVAPFKGIITRKMIQQGDLAAPGTPLFRIESMDTKEIRLAVPASLPFPSIGTEFPVSHGDQVALARMTAISPSTDIQSRTREAVLSLPSDADMPAGSHVRVYWPDLQVKGIWIPASAIRELGQLKQVFVAENGIARLRLIKPGQAFADEVLIQAGLRSGDQVILAPALSLRDGQRVEVVR